jgi:hypothetical protein
MPRCVVVFKVLCAVSKPHRNLRATVSALSCECRSLAPTNATPTSSFSLFVVVTCTTVTILRIKDAGSNTARSDPQLHCSPHDAQRGILSSAQTFRYVTCSMVRSFETAVADVFTSPGFHGVSTVRSIMRQFLYSQAVGTRESK